MKWFFILLMFFFTCSCKSEKKEMQYDDSVASVGDIADTSIVDEGISASTIDKNV